MRSLHASVIRLWTSTFSPFALLVFLFQDFSSCLILIYSAELSLRIIGINSYWVWFRARII